MDFKKIRDTFWDQGYVIFEKFFDDSLMDLYNDKILEHFGVNPDWEHTDEFISKSAVEVIHGFHIAMVLVVLMEWTRMRILTKLRTPFSRMDGTICIA